MQIQIPIPTLFTQVFGIAGPLVRSYYPSKEEQKNYDPKYLINANEAESTDTVTSSLGTVVQFPMAFVGNQEYLYRSNGKLLKKFMQGMYLPFTSVATFSRNKRITETYMSGQNGSVIEEYGFEPWDIRVQGFILKNDKLTVSGASTVEDQVRELKQWESLSDAIQVKGKHFELLDIHRVAITSLNFPDARNSNIEVVRPFEMRLRSVEPIELIAL